MDLGKLFEKILKFISSSSSKRTTFVGIILLCLFVCLFFLFNIGELDEKFNKSKMVIRKYLSKYDQYKIMHPMGQRILWVGIVVFFLLIIVVASFTMYNKKNNNNKIVTEIDENQPVDEADALVLMIDKRKVYPISVDIKEKQEVGEWTYIIYMYYDEQPDEAYPILFRYKKKGEKKYIGERVSSLACYKYEIANNCVFYLNSCIGCQSHGYLYVSRLDGKNERVLDEELYNFEIYEKKIYYSYCYDTYGVGLDGHAIHSMDLDGDNIQVCSYEVSGNGFSSSHFDFKISDGWIEYDGFKTEIGNPANGFETLIKTDMKEVEWIYYATNRLIKAKSDGSERIQLDDENEYRYEILSVKNKWIYYIKGNNKYKIKKDGTGKKFLGKI